jgi:hypothetical protein
VYAYWTLPWAAVKRKLIIAAPTYVQLEIVRRVANAGSLAELTRDSSCLRALYAAEGIPRQKERIPSEQHAYSNCYGWCAVNSSDRIELPGIRQPAVGNTA